MTNRRQRLLAASTVALGLAGSGSARADAIDGTWCADDGRSLSIEGPQIVTPGGTATRGDDSRHAFAYVVPSSEVGAGTRILMDLLDENTVRLMNGTVSEIWRRCDLTAWGANPIRAAAARNRQQGGRSVAEVFVSSVIDAPIERVWVRIRDFGALPAWVPAVADCRIEDNLPSDRVGCVRNFNLKDGGNLRETLLGLDDFEHRVTYDIVVSPMPVENYKATLRLLPVTDGNRTYAEWTARFDCKPEDAAALVDNIGNNVFQAAFDTLKQQLAGR